MRKPGRPVITIKNNAGFAIPVSLFGFIAQQDINQLREFNWDMSCEGFLGETQVSIQSKPDEESSYTTYTVQLTVNTLQGTVDALNTLGLGIFYANSPYIVTYNDNRQFGSLELSAPGLTDVTATIDFNTFELGGQFTIYKNCAIIEALGTGGVPSIFFKDLEIGSLILVTLGGSNSVDTTLQIYTPTDTLFDQTVSPGDTISFTFPVTVNEYDLTIRVFQ